MFNNSEPCSAGYYMTDNGCQQCEENTFSGEGASSCTSCPDGKVSAAGSTSVNDCEYGNVRLNKDGLNHISLTIKWDIIVS